MMDCVIQVPRVLVNGRQRAVGIWTVEDDVQIQDG
jgi:hypothetical protein